MEKIRVLLVDKRDLFREGLACILRSNPNFEVVHKCASGSEAIEKACELRPDLILLDTELAEGDFVETTWRLSQSLPEAKVIILTHSEQDSDLFLAIKKGAKAYLCKDVKVDDLIHTLLVVNAGEVVISPPIATRILEEFTRMYETAKLLQNKYDINFTDREIGVLNLIAHGVSNRKIADKLFITENTVKVHLRRIMEKFNVHSRHEVAMLAIEKGIVHGQNNPDK